MRDIHQEYLVRRSERQYRESAGIRQQQLERMLSREQRVSLLDRIVERLRRIGARQSRYSEIVSDTESAGLSSPS